MESIQIWIYFLLVSLWSQLLKTLILLDLAYSFLLVDKVGCMWRVVECNLLSSVYTIFVTECTLLRNVEVGLSLSDMNKSLI